MGAPPIDKTFTGVLRDLATRVNLLERRSSRLPERFSSAGQTVTDWNNAKEPGFYNAQAGALHAPTPTDLFAGVVSTRVDGRVLQDLVNVTVTINNLRLTYRRIYVPATNTWTAWTILHPVHDGGTVAHSALPSTFPFGVSVGQADGSFPNGSPGVVETTKYVDSRAVQRVTYKSDQNSPMWHRSSSTDGSAWGPWSLTAGELAVRTASFGASYSSATTAVTTITTLALPSIPWDVLWVILITGQLGFNSVASNQGLTVTTSAGTLGASRMNGRITVNSAGGQWGAIAGQWKLNVPANSGVATVTISGASSVATGTNYAYIDIVATPRWADAP